MLKQVDIWNWTLEPYEKLGPIPLVDLDRKKLEELLGPPTRDLTQNGKGYVVYETSRYQLFGWIGADEGKIDQLLIPRYPISLRLQTQKRQFTVPKEKEQIPAWMHDADPLTRRQKFGEVEHLIAPTLGLLWDEKVECICVYTQKMRIHLLANENFLTPTVEFLIEPEFEKELRSLRLQYPKVFKDSWSPIIVLEADEKRGLPHCHYGGLPLLGENETYPVCKVCKNPLPLLVQMDLSYLPAVLQKNFGSEGLFQLFYCREEGCITQHSDPYDPPNLIYLCRVLKERKLSPAKENDVQAIPQHQIVDWFQEPDGPSDEMLEAVLGQPLEKIFSGDLGEDCYRFAFPYGTDKWGGDPGWVQGDETIDYIPQCPDCKDRLQVNFVTQYNSNADFECGDGRIFVFQCDRHKEQFLVLLET